MEVLLCIGVTPGGGGGHGPTTFLALKVGMVMYLTLIS